MRLRKVNSSGVSGCKLDGMEVQQMAFDGERIGAKRRTIAHIRHRLETLVVDPQPGNVNAVGGNQFVVTCEIDCRHGVLMAVAASPTGIGEDAERPPSRARARLTFPSAISLRISLLET